MPNKLITYMEKTHIRRVRVGAPQNRKPQAAGHGIRSLQFLTTYREDINKQKEQHNVVRLLAIIGSSFHTRNMISNI